MGLFVKEMNYLSLFITPLQEIGLETPKLTIFSPTQKLLIGFIIIKR
ncbi:hypothetical protein JP0474_09690 [Helicobacter pylori]|nr:hypothetical protein JP0521_12030 [Helicobacter pylori]GHS62834.1 hypothetical protein JP0524_08980 [Helicobacter pylori]